MRGPGALRNRPSCPFERRRDALVKAGEFAQGFGLSVTVQERAAA
jgi:hypothetical protein